MHVTEEYRGFRIEAEAEPIAASVSVRIFALEKDGSFAPDVEPMNVQTFESSGQAGTAELIHDSLAYARSAIDDLFNGNFDNDDGERPRHEIVDDAKSGKPGRLVVPFVSTDPDERLSEIVRVLDSTPLDGLGVKILLNAIDLQGQPTPAERPDLIGIEASSEVPAGEFHLLLKPHIGAGAFVPHSD